MRTYTVDRITRRMNSLPTISIGDLTDFIDKNVSNALTTAYRVGLGKSLDGFEKEADVGMLAQASNFIHMPLGWAAKVEAAVLFVDMRGSTKRSERLSPTHMFATMQALIPTLALIAGKSGGHIVGFRGDGLFVAFGLNDDGANPPDFNVSTSISDAAVCGNNMLDATRFAVNPALKKRNIETGVEVGVGIDHGSIVITKIGLPNAHELTAYGDAVNQAAKLSAGRQQIWLSHRSRKAYPITKGGIANIVPDIGKFILSFPRSFLKA